MKILALETIDQRGSVALLEDDRVVVERLLSPTERSAQSLAPAIAAVLAEAGWNCRDAELIAVTVGPGSFTGLRVGITSARTLAYVTGAAVLGVSSLEVIASGVPVNDASATGDGFATGGANSGRLWTLLDAQRQELFVGRYVARDGVWQPDLSESVMPLPEWRAQLVAGDHVCGLPLAKLREPLPEGVVGLSSELGQPRASGVGRRAVRRYRAGERQDLWQLMPVYLRKSAAEEKWDERQRAATA